MFRASEGEALKEAVEYLKDRAAELLHEVERVETAWKEGNRAALQAWGYLPGFTCSQCGAKGENAVADTGADCETGEALAICKCGHVNA